MFEEVVYCRVKSVVSGGPLSSLGVVFLFSEYKDDQEMIPRNTSVIISRVPLANPVKIPKTQ